MKLHMHVFSPIENARGSNNNYPESACTARVTVVVLCVFLSVDYYSRATGYEAAYEQCKQVQCYKHSED